MKHAQWYILILYFWVSCKQERVLQNNFSGSHVVVKQADSTFMFYVNDKPFHLKGIGVNFEYGHDFDALKRTGANAIRTWGTKYADTIFKLASNHGLMVAQGINIGKELYGFDYNDTIAVKKQFRLVKSIIQKYKGRPNLLCWVVGNELNLLFDEKGQLKTVNPKIYSAVSQIIDYIHTEDPHHPVTVTFAGVIKDDLLTGLKLMPELDIVSVQVYGDLGRVQQLMESTGIKKPYMVTEFGPKGFWEMPKTIWGREIEEPSGPKVDGIIERMQSGLTNNSSRKCLGGFAFVWGQKHERTPTWYGMQQEDGKQTEYVDALTKFWTGKYPQNRAPRVDSILLDSKGATENIYLKPNRTYEAQVFASDPDHDSILFKWEIAKEVNLRSLGGEKEQKPERIPVNVIKNEYGKYQFSAPKEQGEYRILVYVYDGKNKAGNANVPFYVKP